MQQTTVYYEDGTGGAVRPVKIRGYWRAISGGMEFDCELDERRVPARVVTMWVPMHRVVRTETMEV